MTAVRLLVAGYVDRTDRLMSSARSVADTVRSLSGRTPVAATDVHLLDLDGDSARFEVAFDDEDGAWATGESLDRIERLRLGSSHFTIDEIHAIEVDLDRRAAEEDPHDRWDVRFLSPTTFEGASFPNPDVLVRQLLRTALPASADLALSFVDADIGAVLELDQFDVQSVPVADRLGWIGRVRYRRGPGAGDRPISVLLRAGDCLGVGDDRQSGCGVMASDPIRPRNRP